MLDGLYLVAQVLACLGRYEEALPIAQAVVNAEEASPAMGPNHPNTLLSRELVAQIRDHLDGLSIGTA